MNEEALKARIRVTLAMHQKVKGLRGIGTTCTCGFWTMSKQLIDHQSAVLAKTLKENGHAMA